MAVLRDDLETLSISEPAYPRGKKVYCLFGGDNETAPMVAAVKAGFAALGLKHDFEARPTIIGEDIEDEVRDDNVGGALIALELSAPIILEAEYVLERWVDLECINVITKDSFKDLHVSNTYTTAITALVLKHMPKSGLAKALVLGQGIFSKVATDVFQELNIDFATWDVDDPYHFDLSKHDFTDVAFVVSGISTKHSLPTFPEGALKPDTLVIDLTVSQKKNSPLMELANASKSHAVSGIEMEFETTLLSFQTLVSPVGVPDSVAAPSKIMAQAYVDALTGEVAQEVPPMIKAYLNA